MQLIECASEAQLNAQAFSDVGNATSSIAYQNFNRFFHWYYFPANDVFAPSKFIGYKNTNLDNYASKGTGTDTQRVLSRWFSKVPVLETQYDQLRIKLERFAESIEKNINKKTFDGTGGIYIPSEEFTDSQFPNEIPKNGLLEGTFKRVTVNAYERNLKAREKCIKHYGAKCCVCEFDFENVYGELGAGFIHVHHLIEISTIGETYEVDPVEDLCPVCPNCHAMLHREKPAMLPEKLKSLINIET
ncbi:HNH endonuclease [Desulfobulbus sp. US4]|nr:HNH endonuclease [Desulfobulbus sp. US4]